MFQPIIIFLAIMITLAVLKPDRLYKDGKMIKFGHGEGKSLVTVHSIAFVVAVVIFFCYAMVNCLQWAVCSICDG